MIDEFLDSLRTGEVLSARDALETHALCERVVDVVAGSSH
jgi:virulence factor